MTSPWAAWRCDNLRDANQTNSNKKHGVRAGQRHALTLESERTTETNGGWSLDDLEHPVPHQGNSDSGIGCEAWSFSIATNCCASQTRLPVPPLGVPELAFILGVSTGFLFPSFLLFHCLRPFRSKRCPAITSVFCCEEFHCFILLTLFLGHVHFLLSLLCKIGQ